MQDCKYATRIVPTVNVMGREQSDSSRLLLISMMYVRTSPNDPESFKTEGNVVVAHVNGIQSTKSTFFLVWDIVYDWTFGPTNFRLIGSRRVSDCYTVTTSRWSVLNASWSAEHLISDATRFMAQNTKVCALCVQLAMIRPLGRGIVCD
ncbi:hypothetical protein J007_00913 [Cryptococcus neoformans]|nr:hypothetical protein J007_00913 [Cryptococcus neoformans var. grubii]OXC64543.1 hypothetical protein C358_00913 [Cryptococcus neoformans var. grubii MW-RSA852]